MLLPPAMLRFPAVLHDSPIAPAVLCARGDPPRPARRQTAKLYVIRFESFLVACHAAQFDSAFAIGHSQEQP